MNLSEFNVWEGIYPSFRDAPQAGPGFAGEKWRAASLSLARDTLAKAERGELLDFSLRQRNAVLPVVVSIIQSSGKKVRVLDVGGGLGAGYAFLNTALVDRLAEIQYDILEIPEICEIGMSLFGKRAGPTFLTEFPQTAPQYDIVYSASALQYIEDWKHFLEQASRMGSDYLLLSDVFISPKESFVTLQNYYGSKIPSWFVNEDDLIGLLSKLGYSLAHKLPCTPQILGKIGPLPMANFPAEYRSEHAWHLLFTARKT